MQFAVMTWVASNAKVGSIFGVLDKDNPGSLPRPTDEPGGYWKDFRHVDESRFPEAEAAKKAIAEHGYYFVGCFRDRDRNLRVTTAKLGHYRTRTAQAATDWRGARVG